MVGAGRAEMGHALLRVVVLGMLLFGREETGDAIL
jgi:hypothetical protein